VRYFAIVLLLVALTASANEPEWQEVASNDEAVVEVDAANVRVREGVLTAWVRVTTPRDIGDKGTKFRSAVSLSVFECDAEKSGVSFTTFFAGPRGEGKIVHTEEGLPVDLARLSYDRPGTTGYAVLMFVCKRTERSGTVGAEAAKLRMAEAEPARPALVEAELVRDSQQVGTPANVTRPVNPDDYYPSGSIRRQEQGSPVVQACVGPTGKLLRDPVVTDTSGFPDLDGAAIKVARAMGYASGVDERGTALPASCLKFKVKFSLHK
jgi:hypothetical protein